MQPDMISKWKRKNARQINNTSSFSDTTQRDKIKTVLALMNELRVQGLTGSNEQLDALPSSKTALVCKLAQVHPEIWMILSLQAKKWLLNKRKRQRQFEDKSKSLSDTIGNDTFVMSERNKNTSSIIPNECAKVKNSLKGEEEVQDGTDHGNSIVDGFLEKALNSSNIYWKDK
jgi:hypothetical protein